MLFDMDDLDQLGERDLQADGLLPAALLQYRVQTRQIAEAGYIIPVAAALGRVPRRLFSAG